MTTTELTSLPARRTVPAHAAPLAHRWPAALGLAVAVATVYDLSDGAGLAVIIALPVMVYMAVAALGKPSASWPVFVIALALVAVAEALAIEPVIALAVVTAICIFAGTVRRGFRPDRLFRVQTWGALGFGAAAMAALYINPTAGGLLVAAGLFGHGTWDVFHHRRNIVVARSVAEFCAVLDFTAGAVVLVFTLVTFG